MTTAMYLVFCMATTMLSEAMTGAHRICLGQHGHRGGGGVHAASSLGGWNALHAVHPALKLEGPIHALPGHCHAGMLDPPGLPLCKLHNLRQAPSCVDGFGGSCESLSDSR